MSAPDGLEAAGYTLLGIIVTAVGKAWADRHKSETTKVVATTKYTTQVELAQVQDNTEQRRLDKLERDRDATLAERQLEKVEAQLAKLRVAYDNEVSAGEFQLQLIATLVSDNEFLKVEKAQLERVIISLTEEKAMLLARIERIETELKTSNTNLTLTNEYVKKLVDWVQTEFQPRRDGRSTAPPREPKITPAFDTPAVRRTVPNTPER